MSDTTTSPLPLSADVLIVAELFDEATAFAENSLAENTRRAYASRWRSFCEWCARHDRAPLPCSPATAASFITFLARDHKVSTISQYLTVIRFAHRVQEHPDPTANNTVKTVWQGIRRSLGVAKEQVNALEIDQLRQMMRAIDRTTVKGARDAALILLGVAGALRRSELVALDCEDVDFVEQGVIVHIRRSKTDQEGAGEMVGIPRAISQEICPVRALEHWFTVIAPADGQALFGALFKGGRPRGRRLRGEAVAILIKDVALRAGLNPNKLSGHTMRATLATAASAAGAPVQDIKRHGRWRSSEVVFRYIRPSQLFKENPAARMLQ
jgi:integrase